MSSASLTPLQIRVLELLAGMEPTWTLTGGGALVGFHLGHRATRDLDLFLHGRATLEDYAERVVDRLRAAGLESQSLRSGTALHQLQVRDARDSVVIDLVAEPVAAVEAPVMRAVGTKSIQVDTPHEILVNKLCTLIQRSELRDLVDVQALLAAGGDLRRALRDAPTKDGGFSPLVLTWQLKELPIATMARAEAWPPERVESLEAFRAELTTSLSRLARPPQR